MIIPLLRSPILERCVPMQNVSCELDFFDVVMSKTLRKGYTCAILDDED